MERNIQFLQASELFQKCKMKAMTEKDERGRLCGVMKIEEECHKLLETGTRYFLLDLEEGKLKLYFDRPEHLPKTCTPCNEIELNFISKVSDARKVRPKAGFCFCITYTGDQIYIQADTEEEMLQWVEQLNEACKVTVLHTQSPTLAPPNSRNEVAGGVIVTTMQEYADSGEDSVEHNFPALSLPSFMSGYAIKQGAVIALVYMHVEAADSVFRERTIAFSERKNWKKRYFVLDTNGLSYFKHDQDKEAIKTIALTEIAEARLVAGQHHAHRQNLFEVVTADRTFNIQCDTPTESLSWISHINKFARQTVSSDDYRPVKQIPSSQSQPTSQEEVKPSRSIWSSTLPVERRTKQSIRGPKKSWQFW